LPCSASIVRKREKKFNYKVKVKVIVHGHGRNKRSTTAETANGGLAVISINMKPWVSKN